MPRVRSVRLPRPARTIPRGRQAGPTQPGGDRLLRARLDRQTADLGRRGRGGSRQARRADRLHERRLVETRPGPDPPRLQPPRRVNLGTGARAVLKYRHGQGRRTHGTRRPAHHPRQLRLRPHHRLKTARRGPRPAPPRHPLERAPTSLACPWATASPLPRSRPPALLRSGQRRCADQPHHRGGRGSTEDQRRTNITARVLSPKVVQQTRRVWRRSSPAPPAPVATHARSSTTYSARPAPPNSSISRTAATTAISTSPVSSPVPPSIDPRLVVGCFIHKPDRAIGHFGGQVSGPAVRNVMNRSLLYLGLPPKVDPGDLTQTADAR